MLGIDLGSCRVERQRVSVGLLTLYIPHTSASLLIQENASPDVRRDLGAFLHRIVPEKYRALPPQ
jgi:secondary thiamine-phosphate synthase enzyme